MYKIKHSRRFCEDIKKIFKQKQEFQKDLDEVIEKIIDYKKRAKRNKVHKLQGEFKNCYACHLKSDIVLIYKINKKKQIIYLLRTGSHNDLF